MKWALIAISCFFTWSIDSSHSTDPDPRDIIQKVQDRQLGDTNQSTISMKIIRPKWSRTVEMKSWAIGDDLSLILITDPARDKGVAFLKNDKEIWNWQPKIDRTVKLPPSMMMQSWMGSDFTNDDLVKQSSIVDDYTHSLEESETIEGRDCYVIKLIPNEDAAVVWGAIKMWVDKKDYLQLKTQFFDEDDYLVNTMLGKEIKMLGGKLLPSVLEILPEDEPGNKTVIIYKSLEFDIPLKESFFTVQNMKRIR